MKRGIVFTIDAMLAIAILVALFASLVVFGAADSRGGAVHALMYVGSQDGAVNVFLIGGSTQDNPPGVGSANCVQVLDYKWHPRPDSSNNVLKKVVKCTQG